MNWTEWMNRSNDGSLFAEVFFLPCIPQKKTIFLEWNKMERPVCRFEARMDRKETFFSSAGRLLILDRENSSIPQPITMKPLLWDTSSIQGTKFFSALIKIFYPLVNPSPTSIQGTPLFRRHLVPWSQGCSLNRGSAVFDGLAHDCRVIQWRRTEIWFEFSCFQGKNSILINF